MQKYAKSHTIYQMTNKGLSTDSYKGVRDFYPEEMAVQRYMFDVWSQTAESFGFEHYDASVLEPSDLYKAKGAENAEMVNEQTYTFTDRGDREVTLRPEMTPTVARMIAGKRRELSFPVRWYSIPNLFRYERAQRGRLREHWQLNCDIFGTDDYTADVEVISLAYQIFMNFGADEKMFKIHVNNRKSMKAAYNALGIEEEKMIDAITRLNDRKNKITAFEYKEALVEIVHNKTLATDIQKMVDSTDPGDNKVIKGLEALGINNVQIDRSIARGFNYYTGTIFEFFDTDPENNRALLGGGRYDNLTEMFGGEAIPGIGFGFGDVTMRHFLESHDLLTSNITAPELVVIPAETTQNLEAQKVAQFFRTAGMSVSVNMGTQKLGKKISSAGEALVEYVLVLGENEINSGTYIVKNLIDKEEITGTLPELVERLTGKI